MLGFGLPVIGYLLLLATRRVDHMNAAAIAAHYGSVSAGTFLTAIAYLDNLGAEYESYPVIMLAVMESPAIIVGLLLGLILGFFGFWRVYLSQHDFWLSLSTGLTFLCALAAV